MDILLKIYKLLAINIPLFASLVALFISALALYVSEKQFLFSSRPYILVENHGYLDKNNVIVNDISTARIMSLNTAAKVISEKYEYGIFKENQLIKNLDSQVYQSSILYPTDKIQYTRRTNLDIPESYKLISPDQEIRRTVRIDYIGLSNGRKYFFKGVWKFDVSDGVWKAIEIDGN